MNQMNRKLMELMNDPAVRNNPKIQSLINSQEGKKIASSLSSAQKQNLLDAFSQMDTAEVKRKISRMNGGSLKNMTPEQIVKALKNL